MTHNTIRERFDHCSACSSSGWSPPADIRHGQGRRDGRGLRPVRAQKSITQTAEMAVGDQVKVTLCSNPTTGFAWQEPEISDAAVVSLADKSFGAPVTGAAQVVGASGTDYITLKATAKGTSTVILRYSQPWAGGTSSEWTYTLTVTVQ